MLVPGSGFQQQHLPSKACYEWTCRVPSSVGTLPAGHTHMDGAIMAEAHLGLNGEGCSPKHD